MRVFRLKKDLPFLRRGALFLFDDESGEVFSSENIIGTQWNKYPLRPGLSGYLWLLLTDGRKYFKKENL